MEPPLRLLRSASLYPSRYPRLDEVGDILLPRRCRRRRASEGHERGKLGGEICLILFEEHGTPKASPIVSCILQAAKANRERRDRAKLKLLSVRPNAI